jgi:hypothetical protein
MAPQSFLSNGYYEHLPVGGALWSECEADHLSLNFCCNLTLAVHLFDIAKIATMLQPTLQPVMLLEGNISALNKTLAQNWKNKVADSSVGKSYKLNAKHTDLSVYRNIPRALQTFGARARLGHIMT